MKILLCAYSCWPTESSEPGVGWRFARLLSENHQVWLLVQKTPGNVKRIGEYLETSPNPNITVVYHPKSYFWIRFARRWINFYYPLWQRSIFPQCRRLHEENQFDLVHHVTLSRYWVGSSLVNLGVPFVWGPVGAAEDPPESFVEDLPFPARRACFLRSNIKRIFELDPLVRKTARKAALTIAITEETEKKVRSLGATQVVRMPQIHFSDHRLEELGKTPQPDSFRPLKLVSVGRLLYWKGFHLGIQMVSDLVIRGVEVEYEVVNDGPFRLDLEKLAKRLNVSDRVKFCGHLPCYDEVLAKMAAAHFLVHPALHEAFGNVCLEALAMGRPVICLNIGGPAIQVTSACGFVAPAINPDEAVKCASNFLAQTTFEQWRAMSNSARERANTSFRESHLKHELEALYRDVLGNRA